MGVIRRAVAGLCITSVALAAQSCASSKVSAPAERTRPEATQTNAPEKDGWKIIADSLKVRFGDVQTFAARGWEGFTEFGVMTHERWGRFLRKPTAVFKMMQEEQLENPFLEYRCQNNAVTIRYGTYADSLDKQGATTQFRIDGKRLVAQGANGGKLTSLKLKRDKYGDVRPVYEGKEELGFGEWAGGSKSFFRLSDTLQKAKRIEFSIHKEKSNKGIYARWEFEQPIADMDLQSACEQMGATVLRIAPSEETSRNDGADATS